MIYTCINRYIDIYKYIYVHVYISDIICNTYGECNMHQIIHVSAEPPGPSRRVQVLCSPMGETRIEETLGPGGPTPTHTYLHPTTPT